MSKQNRSKKYSKIDIDKELVKKLLQILQDTNIGFDDIENRPVTIPIATVRRIINTKEIKTPAIALGIYTFIYSRGREEKTNKPWITNEYIAKGLNLNARTVSKYRKYLTDIGLISGETIRKNGRIIKHITHIRYFDGILIRDPELIKALITILHSYHMVGKLPCSATRPNAYSKKANACSKNSSSKNSKINASLPQQNAEGKGCVELNSSSPTIFGNSPVKSNFATTSAKKLWSKVVSKRQLPPNSKDRSKWAMQFTMLNQRDGRTKKRIRSVLDWYLEHYGEDYVPEARCANTFRKKFCSIESAMNRWLKKQGQDVRDSDPQVIRQNIGHRQMD